MHETIASVRAILRRCDSVLLMCLDYTSDRRIVAALDAASDAIGAAVYSLGVALERLEGGLDRPGKEE